MVRIRQRRLLGWVMIIAGLVVPIGFAISEWNKIKVDPLQFLTKYFNSLGFLPASALVIGCLLMAFLVIYGIIWLFWVRQLEIDTSIGRYKFSTGIVIPLSIDVKKRSFSWNHYGLSSPLGEDARDKI